MKKTKRCRGWKASYTVEASLIVPIFLTVIGMTVKIGIDLHQEIVNQKEEQNIADLWMVKDFYLYQVVGEVFDDQS